MCFSSHVLFSYVCFDVKSIDLGTILSQLVSSGPWFYVHQLSEDNKRDSEQQMQVMSM